MTLTNDRCAAVAIGSSGVLTTAIDHRIDPDQALSLAETYENAGQLRRIGERQPKPQPIASSL